MKETFSSIDERVFFAVKNRSVEVVKLVALFLLEMGTFGAENLYTTSVDALFFLEANGNVPLDGVAFSRLD